MAHTVSAQAPSTLLDEIVDGTRVAIAPTSGVTAGSYANANITVDVKGIVTAASNGSVSSSYFQTIQSVSQTPFNTTSTAFQEVGLSASIVPSSSSHKILVTAVGRVYQPTASRELYLAVFCNGTKLFGGTTGYNNAGNFAQQVCINYLHAPGTTSTVTYSVRIHSTSGETVYFMSNGSDDGTATLTLQEVS